MTKNAVFDLDGRVDTVIGGTGALGAAICHGLAEPGAAIAVLGRSRERAEARVAALDASGATAFAAILDAAQPASVMNCITSKTPEGARIALTVETDREAIDVALACCLKVRAGDARMAWVLDPKNLGSFYATEALLPALRESGVCDVVGGLGPIALDVSGRLTDAPPA